MSARKRREIVRLLSNYPGRYYTEVELALMCGHDPGSLYGSLSDLERRGKITGRPRRWRLGPSYKGPSNREYGLPESAPDGPLQAE